MPPCLTAEASVPKPAPVLHNTPVAAHTCPPPQQGSEGLTQSVAHLPHFATAAGVYPRRLFLPSVTEPFFVPADHSTQDVTSGHNEQLHAPCSPADFHSARSTNDQRCSRRRNHTFSNRTSRKKHSGEHRQLRHAACVTLCFDFSCRGWNGDVRSRIRAGVRSVGNIRQTEGGATLDSSL